MLSAGGLYIIGTERHESRRIDNQLRGRSGRQGDPGASRFYLSLEDDLLRIFGGQNMQKIMDMLKVPDDEAITARAVTRSIARAQKRVEGHNFDIRKHLLEYDNVMNRQRTVIYQMRRNIMDLKKVERQCLDFLSEVTSHLLDTYISQGLKPEQWNFRGLQQALYKQFGLDLLESRIKEGVLNSPEGDKALVSLVKEEVKTAYDEKKQELKEHFPPVAQLILLQTLDARWKEHLENIDRLKEGINLRAYAQKDPLIEYKKESFFLFEQMSLQVGSEAIEKLFKIQIQTEQDYKMQKSPNSLNDERWDYDRPPVNFERAKETRPEGPPPQQTLNRAQRRRQKQSAKKRKIKI